MLNDPVSVPFDSVQSIGFAIMRTGAHQWHVGMLYKINGHAARLRHLCWHLEVKDDDLCDFRYMWVDVAALGPQNKRLLALRLSKVGKDKVPYGVGFKEDGEYIDKKTLRYRKTVLGDGLTCATYVLEILQTFGHKPFVFSQWVATQPDIDWQKATIAENEAKYPNDIAHFSAERSNIGGARFRPEHITASGKENKWPVSQESADTGGAAVIVKYNLERPITIYN